VVAVTTAALTFTVDTGAKPVSGSTVVGGRITQHKGQRAMIPVPIANGRDLGATDLDREGFRLVSHASAVQDLYDEDALHRVYYPEIETLIAGLSGATRVVVFDHTLRHGSEDEQEKRHLREPVRIVHNDYTDWSGPQRVRDLYPDEADRLLAGRMAIIQAWRPIVGPLQRDPLAICDARSLGPDDLIAAERRHEDRIGEIYHVAHRATQRWYYFPEMTREEVLIFKCFDSLCDGRARFTAHGSFEDPNSPPNAPPRESIEIRTFAFFD
jgi:hypothetical protein